MTIAERLEQEARRKVQKEIAQAMLRKDVDPGFVIEVILLTK